MKVLQTPPRFYPRKGGIEEASFYLSKELAKRGHNVKIICADEPSVGDLIIESIKVRRISYIGKISNTNITLSLGKELLKEEFDVIHTHLPHPWSADISAAVSFIKNKPLFLTYYNDITGNGINKFIADFYNFTALKFLLKRAHRIFIAHKNYYKSSPFLKPYMNKIIVTPFGVDLEKFKPSTLAKEDSNIVFFLSRLDKFHIYKGLHYLLLSVKKIIQKVPLKLYIGGDGDLLDYYKEFVRENGLEKVVHFLGFLDDKQLVRHYSLCDVFVLPSISSTQEGFGLVALEAMACKKPVIVTDIVGVAEDVKKYNAGIVVSPKNVEELSKNLEYLLLNKNKCEEMGINAYNLVKNKYTWENHCNIVENEYKKVCRV